MDELDPTEEPHGVLVDKFDFTVLPTSAIGKERRLLMGMTSDQIKNPDGMGFYTEFHAPTSTMTFRVFLGKRIARDMRKLCQIHNLTYDRMCRVFFVNFMILQTLSPEKEGDDEFVMSVLYMMANLIDLKEISVAISMVRDHAEENELDATSFPDKISRFIYANPNHQNGSS